MFSKAAQIPEELFKVLLKHLCINERPPSAATSFEPRLARCSLTCRYWATHIRPVLFSKIALKSQDDVHTLATLLRSPVDVPGPLYAAVRAICLHMDSLSRPWMYHIWALLRDGMLPNVQSLDVKLNGHGVGYLKVGRHKCECLLDIGLPRTIPHAPYPIRLRELHLDRFSFYSYTQLVRCIAYHLTDNVYCFEVDTPHQTAALTPRILTRLASHAPRVIPITSRGSRILPFVRSLVAPHPPASGAQHCRLLCVDITQRSAIMNIFWQFSDGCQCSWCLRERRGIKTYTLEVYAGMCRLNYKLLVLICVRFNT